MILRNLICIPSYDNPNTVAQVVSDCLSATSFPILLVDDGSHKPVEALLKNPDHLRALSSGRLTLHRFAENQGKGVALRWAINFAVKKGFTHLITMDSDGQHLASEISKLTDVSLKHPWDLIIGNRQMEGTEVPEISRFGKKFSNYWVKYETDLMVSDSQSGFRIYPLFHLQNLKFWTRKFDFEIEVLIRLLWKGVGIQDAPVKCHYFKGEKRVTHFHKFYDNVRITLLNILFVALSLLKRHHSPREVAFAVGTGVLIGCTPFFGLHTFIAAAVAFAFRLNFLYLFLGTQVSLPFFAPFVVGASVTTGKFLWPSSQGGITEEFRLWLLGSLVVGSVLGFALGLSAAAASYILRKRTQKPIWTGATRGGNFGLKFMKSLMANFGLKTTHNFLYLIIPYFYLFAPKARRACNEYWQHLRPQASWFKRQWLIHRQLYSFAEVLTDRVYQGLHREPQFVSNPHGIENISEPLNSKTGVIVVGAHAGGWDLAATLLPQDGLREDFFMLQYQHQGLTVEKAVDQRDEEHVHRIFYNLQHLPIFQIRQLIEQGKPVGIMGDRPVSNHYELIPFFGRLAAFDCTPYRIASATQAKVLFSFGFKKQRREYDFFATLAVSFNQSSQNVLQSYEMAQAFAHKLEELLNCYPEQWFNFFDFWSAEPLHARSEQASKQRHYLREELNTPPKAPPVSELGPTPIAAIGSPDS